MRSLAYSTLFFLQWITLSRAAANNVLLVGDSFSSFMGQTIKSFCSDVNVYNAGIGGTTATQWASFTSDELETCKDEQDMTYSSVLISVGGNDLLESGCSLSTTELRQVMEDAVLNVVTNVAPGATNYVMTGYCMPAAPEEEAGEGCNSPQAFAKLSEAFKDINVSMPSGSILTVVDSFEVCGGSSTAFSDEKYFQDPIHLNAKGYCKVFTQDAVQTAMSCGTTTAIDCDSFETEIYGLDENCLDDVPNNGNFLQVTSGLVLASFALMLAQTL